MFLFSSPSVVLCSRTNSSSSEWAYVGLCVCVRCGLCVIGTPAECCVIGRKSLTGSVEGAAAAVCDKELCLDREGGLGFRETWEKSEGKFVRSFVFLFGLCVEGKS